MTIEQFRKVWRRLSWWRQEWTRHKARIEGRSVGAVLSEWTPPTTRECKAMLGGGR